MSPERKCGPPGEPRKDAPLLESLRWGRVLLPPLAWGRGGATGAGHEKRGTALLETGLVGTGRRFMALGPYLFKSREGN